VDHLEPGTVRPQSVVCWDEVPSATWRSTGVTSRCQTDEPYALLLEASPRILAHSTH